MFRQKVGKNQVHVISQFDKPERIFTEGEKYWWIPTVIPKYGMIAIIYTLKDEFSEISISEPKYW